MSTLVRFISSRATLAPGTVDVIICCIKALICGLLLKAR